MQSETLVQDLLLKVLAKVNDRVLEFASAARGITDATGQVILSTHAGLVVPHVLSIALYADFQVSVSVEFRKVLRFDATLTMQTINILTDNALENPTILQLYQRHVGR